MSSVLCGLCNPDPGDLLFDLTVLAKCQTFHGSVIPHRMKGGAVVALRSIRYAGIRFGQEPDAQTRLSSRSALLAVAALSLLSWAVILLPLWAVLRSIA